MGTKGKEIVGMDVEQLLKLLNMASLVRGSPITNTGWEPKSLRDR
jgi:hypothetical protein